MTKQTSNSIEEVAHDCRISAAPRTRISAQSSLLSVIYKAYHRTSSDSELIDDDRHWGIIQMEAVWFSFGYPNNEGLFGHPLADLGVLPHGMFEVHDSGLVRDIISYRQNPTSRWSKGLRHIIVSFPDATLEAVTRAVKLTCESAAFESVVAKYL